MSRRIAGLPYGTIDVVDFLEQLGIKSITRVGDEVKFSCPFPGHSHEDKSPSAFMNSLSTAFICFACQQRGNAVGFLSQLENISPVEAAGLIYERYSDGYTEMIPIDKYIHNILSGKEPEEDHKDLLKIIDPESLELFKVDWDYIRRQEYITDEEAYFLERGFHPRILDQYKVGWDDLSRRFTIPAWNDSGELVGFKGRTPYSEVRPKYKVIGDTSDNGNYGFAPYSTGKVVWGIDSVTSDNLIVCEGELNALKMRQYKYGNAVGISGSHVTNDQIDIIRERAKKVTLFFDSDKAGNLGAWDAATRLQQWMRVRIVPDHVGDPASMTDRQIRKLLASSVSPLELDLDRKLSAVES